MTEQPSPTNPTKANKPKAKPKIHKWVVVLAVLGLLGGTGYWAMGGFSNSSQLSDAQIIKHTVALQSFDVSVKLSGELKANRTIEVKNDVEGQTTILWIVPEGKRVKQGEVIVRLAQDSIRERVEDFRIKVTNDDAARINAAEQLKIQENQNESDIQGSEINAEMAKMEYQQYSSADTINQRTNLMVAYENAQVKLERRTADLQHTKDLAKDGFVNGNDILDAEIQFRDADNELRASKLALKAFDEYSNPRQLRQLERKQAESAREAERVKRRTAANILLKEADLRAKEAQLRVNASRLAQLEKQLEATIITAPQDGMIVYQSSVGQQNQSGGVIEEGATVRQNQTLIQLPDTTEMLVEVRLAEQLIDRVEVGQRATVTIDAVPGMVLTGNVRSISVLPDNTNRWQNPIKEYPMMIELDQTPSGVKPGMSTRVEVLVRRLDDVIAVPVAAVFAGARRSYVVVPTALGYERRTVETGLASSDWIEIKSGLKVDDVVLLSKPKDLPDEVAVGAESQPGKRRKRPDLGITTYGSTQPATTRSRRHTTTAEATTQPVTTQPTP
ncbi:MAG: efflux RND transporter periplasmic adaptor subunit [Phycisphaerae bacterium]